MVSVILQFPVKDFNKWKATFDANSEVRRAAGSQGYMVFQQAENPNQVVILQHWDSQENMERFVTSPELRALQQQAGVLAPPQVTALSFVDEGSA